MSRRPPHEVERKAETAVLVGVELPDGGAPIGDGETSLDELARLCDTAGVEVVGRTVQRRRKPDVRTFVGAGSLTVNLYGTPVDRRVEFEPGPLEVTGPPEVRRIDDPDLYVGESYVEDSGEGRWTVEESINTAVPAPTIALSLMMRFRSRQENSFGARMLAAMRQQFGGHAVKPK